MKAKTPFSAALMALVLANALLWVAFHRRPRSQAASHNLAPQQTNPAAQRKEMIHKLAEIGQLLKTQNELLKTQNELLKTQNELLTSGNVKVVVSDA